MRFQNKQLFYYFSLWLSSLLFLRCLEYSSAVSKLGKPCSTRITLWFQVSELKTVTNFKSYVTNYGHLLLLA